MNWHVVRKDKAKLLPSGIAPSIAYELCGDYGGVDCLQKVDRKVIKDLMDALGGESLLEFCSPEYDAHAQAVLDDLNITEMTMQNAWKVFSLMLPFM